jgi:hypothetical protein
MSNNMFSKMFPLKLKVNLSVQPRSLTAPSQPSEEKKTKVVIPPEMMSLLMYFIFTEKQATSPGLLTYIDKQEDFVLVGKEDLETVDDFVPIEHDDAIEPQQRISCPR